MLISLLGKALYDLSLCWCCSIAVYNRLVSIIFEFGVDDYTHPVRTSDVQLMCHLRQSR